MASDRRLKEIRGLIENDGRASEALRQLKGRGLDTGVVLNDLFLFCGGTAEEVRAQLKRDKKFRDDLINVSAELERLARRVEIIAPEIEKKFPIRIYVPERDDVVLRLRDQADLYRKLVGGYYGPYLKNVRIGCKERNANITSGRDRHFLYLIYRVSEGKTPKTEHYRLVAPLVAAVTGDKRDLNRISDSLRKKFERFASKGSEKDRQRLELDKGTIEVSVREELKERRAQIASPKDTFLPKKF
jgi:hypothetical protein